MEKILIKLKHYKNERFVSLLTEDPQIVSEKEIIIAQEKKQKPEEKHKDTTGEDRLNDLQTVIKEKLLKLKNENGMLVAKIYFEKTGLTIMAHDPLNPETQSLLLSEIAPWIKWQNY